MATTGQITATIAPSDASNKGITWSSSDPSIATVAPVTGSPHIGLVTAKAVGSCTITATTADGAKVAECVVTVATVPVTGITLNKTAQTINKGATFQLTATISPADASIQALTWSSSDTAIATVNATGKVTAVAGGTATITCKATDGSNKTATCDITVNVPATGVTVAPTTLSLNF